MIRTPDLKESFQPLKWMTATTKMSEASNIEQEMTSPEELITTVSVNCARLAHGGGGTIPATNI